MTSWGLIIAPNRIASLSLSAPSVSLLLNHLCGESTRAFARSFQRYLRHVPVACAAGHQAWKARFCRASPRVSLFGICVGTDEIRRSSNLAGAGEGPRHHGD